MNISCVEFDKLDGKYYQIKHSSGINLYYYPTPGKSKKAAMIATKFGSINREFQKFDSDEWMEVPDGIAHFLEHKLFEGEQGNAFDYYAKTGAKANAYTSNDRTAYYFVTTDHFYESLDILLRFVKHPYFTPENVEKEKGIIGQEIRMYDDESGWQGYISLVQALYHNNPVRIDIAGTTQTIAEITDKMLYDCYRVYYNNSNLTLCIAGDLDLDKILEVCDKRLPKEPKHCISQHFPSEPDDIVNAFVEKQMDVSKAQFFIGIKDNSIPSDNEEIWKHILSVRIVLSALFGESSKFYKRLYQDGVINSEFSHDYEYGVGYGFALFVGESDEAQRVKDEIASVCKNFSLEDFSEESFRRIRNSIYGDMVRSLDSADSIVNRFVSARLLGGDVFSSLRAISQLDYIEVFKVGQKLLDPSLISLSHIKPKESR